MTDQAVGRWNVEAVTFDDAPDHGLKEASVRAAWEDLLSQKLPAAPAGVADLGCGTGTLSVLLADRGYAVDGVDFSPEMLRLAEVKASGRARVNLLLGDAYEPPLPRASYDVVLSRHVLWAMPDPAVALRRWIGLLKPQGVLVLVEGRWSNGAGLTADQTFALVRATGRPAEVTMMNDPAYWGRPIDDERYLLVSTGPQRPEALRLGTVELRD